MMRKFLLYTWLLTILLAFPDGVQAKLFNGEEFYLDNGLRVIVLPNHRVPIVKHMLWYKSGSADEPVGKGGIAHLLEHLMFRGTEKVSGQELNALLEENGAESNAFTSYDVTAYHQLLDRSRLELAMFLEADRMQKLKISPQDFELERKIVYEEREQRVGSNPLARFGEVLNRTLWQNHPYGRPISGTEQEILALTRADAEQFYRRHYTPDNAILVLSGDITREEAEKLAQKYYGNLKPAENHESKKLISPLPQMSASVEMKMPEIQGMRFIKTYASPSLNYKKDDVYALVVWATYFGDGETSVLHKKLVLRDKVALDADADYDMAARGYGRFSVTVLPVPGTSVSDLQAALRNVWAEALAEFDAKTAEKAKQKTLAGLIYLNDNPENAAYFAGSLAVAGMSLAEIEGLEERIKNIKADEIIRAAKSLEENAPAVSGVLMPEDKN